MMETKAKPHRRKSTLDLLQRAITTGTALGKLQRQRSQSINFRPGELDEDEPDNVKKTPEPEPPTGKYKMRTSGTFPRPSKPATPASSGARKSQQRTRSLFPEQTSEGHKKSVLKHLASVVAMEELEDLEPELATHSKKVFEAIDNRQLGVPMTAAKEPETPASAIEPREDEEEPDADWKMLMQHRRRQRERAEISPGASPDAAGGLAQELAMATSSSMLGLGRDVRAAAHAPPEGQRTTPAEGPGPSVHSTHSPLKHHPSAKGTVALPGSTGMAFSRPTPKSGAGAVGEAGTGKRGQAPRQGSAIEAQERDWEDTEDVEEDADDMSGIASCPTLQTLFATTHEGIMAVMESLSLENERITRFPAALLGNFPALKTLNISFNGIKRLPSRSIVTSLPHLVTLNLRHNRLQALEDVIWLGNLQELQTLDIRDNPLPRIHQRLLLLDALLYSDAGSTRRAGLDAELDAQAVASSLEQVEMDNNRPASRGFVSAGNAQGWTKLRHHLLAKTSSAPSADGPGASGRLGRVVEVESDAPQAGNIQRDLSKMSIIDTLTLIKNGANSLTGKDSDAGAKAGSAVNSHSSGSGTKGTPGGRAEQGQDRKGKGLVPPDGQPGDAKLVLMVEGATKANMKMKKKKMTKGGPKSPGAKATKQGSSKGQRRKEGAPKPTQLRTGGRLTLDLTPADVPRDGRFPVLVELNGYSITREELDLAVAEREYTQQTLLHGLKSKGQDGSGIPTDIEAHEMWNLGTAYAAFDRYKRNMATLRAEASAAAVHQQFGSNAPGGAQAQDGQGPNAAKSEAPRHGAGTIFAELVGELVNHKRKAALDQAAHEAEKHRLKSLLRHGITDDPRKPGGAPASDDDEQLSDVASSESGSEEEVILGLSPAEQQERRQANAVFRAVDAQPGEGRRALGLDSWTRRRGSTGDDGAATDTAGTAAETGEKDSPDARQGHTKTKPHPSAAGAGDGTAGAHDGADTDFDDDEDALMDWDVDSNSYDILAIMGEPEKMRRRILANNKKLLELTNKTLGTTNAQMGSSATDDSMRQFLGSFEEASQAIVQEDYLPALLNGTLSAEEAAGFAELFRQNYLRQQAYYDRMVGPRPKTESAFDESATLEDMVRTLRMIDLNSFLEYENSHQAEHMERAGKLRSQKRLQGLVSGDQQRALASAKHRALAAHRRRLRDLKREGGKTFMAPKDLRGAPLRQWGNSASSTGLVKPGEGTQQPPDLAQLMSLLLVHDIHEHSAELHKDQHGVSDGGGGGSRDRIGDARGSTADGGDRGSPTVIGDGGASDYTTPAAGSNGASASGDNGSGRLDGYSTYGQKSMTQRKIAARQARLRAVLFGEEEDTKNLSASAIYREHRSLAQARAGRKDRRAAAAKEQAKMNEAQSPSSSPPGTAASHRQSGELGTATGTAKPSPKPGDKMLTKRDSTPLPHPHGHLRRDTGMPTGSTLKRVHAKAAREKATPKGGFTSMLTGPTSVKVKVKRPAPEPSSTALATPLSESKGQPAARHSPVRASAPAGGVVGPQGHRLRRGGVGSVMSFSSSMMTPVSSEDNDDDIENGSFDGPDRRKTDSALLLPSEDEESVEQAKPPSEATTGFKDTDAAEIWANRVANLGHPGAPGAAGPLRLTKAHSDMRKPSPGRPLGRSLASKDDSDDDDGPRNLTSTLPLHVAGHLKATPASTVLRHASGVRDAEVPQGELELRQWTEQRTKQAHRRDQILRYDPLTGQSHAPVHRAVDTAGRSGGVQRTYPTGPRRTEAAGQSPSRAPPGHIKDKDGSGPRFEGGPTPLLVLESRRAGIPHPGSPQRQLKVVGTRGLEQTKQALAMLLSGKHGNADEVESLSALLEQDQGLAQALGLKPNQVDNTGAYASSSSQGTSTGVVSSSKFDSNGGLEDSKGVAVQGLLSDTTRKFIESELEYESRRHNDIYLVASYLERHHPDLHVPLVIGDKTFEYSPLFAEMERQHRAKAQDAQERAGRARERTERDQRLDRAIADREERKSTSKVSGTTTGGGLPHTGTPGTTGTGTGKPSKSSAHGGAGMLKGQRWTDDEWRDVLADLGTSASGKGAGKGRGKGKGRRRRADTTTSSQREGGPGPGPGSRTGTQLSSKSKSSTITPTRPTQGKRSTTATPPRRPTSRRAPRTPKPHAPATNRRTDSSSRATALNDTVKQLSGQRVTSAPRTRKGVAISGKLLRDTSGRVEASVLPPDPDDDVMPPNTDAAGKRESAQSPEQSTPNFKPMLGELQAQRKHAKARRGVL